MKKPISNFYTVVWIEAPNQPVPPPRRGTRATSAPGSHCGGVVRAKAQRDPCSGWEAGATTALGMFFAHH